MGYLAQGELLVVETEDDWFLGSVEVLPAALVVRTGFRGHPAVIAHEDVRRIAPFSEMDGPQD